MNEEKIPTVQEIVARYLPGVDWDSPTSGRCMCPGAHLHSRQPATRDARVFVNGVPTLTCFHETCRSQVAEVNSKIRTAWGLFQPPTDPQILAEASAKAALRQELENRGKAALPEVLKNHQWNTADMHCDIPIEEQAAVFLHRLWKPEDVIWVGEPEYSGRPEYRTYFRASAEITVDGHYTCASSFLPDTYSRANANVLTTPYMIVEGDKILGEVTTNEDKQRNKDSCGAIFAWLRDSIGCRLIAVVDAGNKSLHGWFAMPPAQLYHELRVVLPAMGCDRAMFKPTQPARLPGVQRDNGNWQRLCYLA